MMNDKYSRQTNKHPQNFRLRRAKNTQNCSPTASKSAPLQNFACGEQKRFSNTPDIPYMGNFCLKILSTILGENLL